MAAALMTAAHCCLSRSQTLLYFLLHLHFFDAATAVVAASSPSSSLAKSGAGELLRREKMSQNDPPLLPQVSPMLKAALKSAMPQGGDEKTDPTLGGNGVPTAGLASIPVEQDRAGQQNFAETLGEHIGNDIVTDLKSELGGSLHSHSDSAQTEILNGKEVPSERWGREIPFVVRLSHDSGIGKATCSGTIIATDNNFAFVLTAGHCINERVIRGESTQMFVSFQSVDKHPLDMAYTTMHLPSGDKEVIVGVGKAGQASESGVEPGLHLTQVNGNAFTQARFDEVKANPEGFNLTFEKTPKGCCKTILLWNGEELQIVEAHKHSMFGRITPAGDGFHDVAIAKVKLDQPGQISRAQLQDYASRVMLSSRDISPEVHDMRLYGFGPYKRGGPLDRLSESNVYNKIDHVEGDAAFVTNNPNDVNPETKKEWPTPSMGGDSGGGYLICKNQAEGGKDEADKNLCVEWGVHSAGHRTEYMPQRLTMVSKARDFIDEITNKMCHWTGPTD
jgi:hypothetical protein